MPEPAGFVFAWLGAVAVFSASGYLWARWDMRRESRQKGRSKVPSDEC